MRKLKYVKLFENFNLRIFESEQFQYFKPEVIDELNYHLESECSGEFRNIKDIAEHCTQRFFEVIKSVEPFKNIKEITTDGTDIQVDWNDVCRPFTIYVDVCMTDHGEYEAIRIGFETEGPYGGDSSYPEVEKLSYERNYHGRSGNFSSCFTFGLNKVEDAWEEKWHNDVIPRLFRNIEKSVYPKES
jgi:hypothetical protein